MKFKLSQASYMDDELDNRGAAIREAGYEFALRADTKQVPGPHWSPLDDEAKALCAKHKVKFTGEVPDCLNELTKTLADTMKRAEDAGSPEKIAAALVAALVQTGIVKAPKMAAADI